MKQIGRYTVEKQIGKGGMAVVYLALDPAMNRQVAIKVLARELSADPDFTERFIRSQLNAGDRSGRPYLR